MPQPGTPKSSRATTVRRRKRRRARNETVYYVVAIESWDWSFMFGVGDARFDDGFYADYRHLELRGKLIRPKSVKADSVSLVFLPGRMTGGEPPGHQPVAVGEVQLYRAAFRALLPMPLDVLPSVLQMLIGERFRFAVITGERMHYGKAMVSRYRLEMSLDEGDLPPDD